MITQKCDIFIEQGADWVFNFPVDPSIDLSLGSAAMMIRTACGSTFIATLTTANNGLQIDAANQQIIAKISNAQTSTFVPLDYIYDVKFQGSNNIIYRTNEGTATIDPQVTNIIPPAFVGDVIGDANGNSIGDADGNQVGN